MKLPFTFTKDLLYLHLAVLLWGFTGLFGKEIALSQVALVWWRMLFTVFFFLIVLVITKKPIWVPRPHRPAAALTGFLIMLHWLCFYGAIKYANISIGLSCLSCGAVVTAVLEPIHKGKKINIINVLWGVLSVVGICIIIKFQYQYKIGILLGITAAFLAAMFTILNSTLTQHNDPITLSMNELLYGLVGLTLLLPIYHTSYPEVGLLPTLRDVHLLLVFSSLCTCLPFVLSMLAMRTLSAFAVTLSVNLEPVYGILAAFWFYQEYQQLDKGFWVGSFFIICSVVGYIVHSHTSKSHTIGQ